MCCCDVDVSCVLCVQHFACGTGQLAVLQVMLSHAPAATAQALLLTDAEKYTPLTLAKSLKPKGWELVVALLAPLLPSASAPAPSTAAAPK
jgi:hypothetical protein